MKNWLFTLVLGISYLAIFHLWLVLRAPWIFLTGAAASAALGLVGFREWRKGYFANGWDALFHGAVLLDIFLEGWLVKFHENLGFYWCAAGFGVVLAVYRLLALKGIGRSRVENNPRKMETATV